MADQNKTKIRCQNLSNVYKLPCPVYGKSAYEIEIEETFNDHPLSNATNASDFDMLSQNSEIIFIKPTNMTEAGINGLLKSSVYQLTSYPISNFQGVSLPKGNRIQFAEVSRWLNRISETRLATVYKKGSKSYYSLDAHVPQGKISHSFYHVNQKGMYNFFSQSNHGSIPANQIIPVKTLRYIKIGGRIFLVAAIIVDAGMLTSSAVKSYETGSYRPLAAQTVRTASSWAAAWAGAKAGVATGTMLGATTGPGIVICAIGGGIVGGLIGFMAGDWIGDKIEEGY